MDFLEFIDELEQEQAYTDQISMSDDPVYMTNEFCDEQFLEESTASAVKEFLEADKLRQPPYEKANIEERAQYLKEFHDNFNEVTGYTNNLHFRENMNPENLGAFNPETKQIDLNERLLLEDDPQQVMETIMHESRHAFQDFAVNHPEQVSVDKETINMWEYNFKHYTRLELVFETDVNHAVEADDNYCSERMFCDGFCQAS